MAFYDLFGQVFENRKEIAKFVVENIEKFKGICSKLGIDEKVLLQVKSKCQECVEDQVLAVLQKIWEVVANLDRDKLKNAFLECIQIISIMRYAIGKISPKYLECMRIPAACLQYLWSFQMKQLSTGSQFPDIYQLQIDVAGACTKLDTSEAFLKGIENHDNLSKIDVHRLETLSINDGAECLGKLRKIIEKEITSKDEHVLKRTTELMKMYMEVQTLRYSYITRLCCVVRSIDPQSPTLAGLERVFDKEEESEIKFLKIFEQPKYENAAFFALFNPSEHNSIYTYLQIKRIAIQDLTKDLQGKMFKIHSQKWPEYLVEMSSFWGGKLRGEYYTSDLKSTFFEFEVISGIDHSFRFKSVKWPSWYVKMDRTIWELEGTKEKNDSYTEWNILRLPDGKYMMSNRVHPNMFIYMTTIFGNLKAAYGDHGNVGHWNFTSIG